MSVRLGTNLLLALFWVQESAFAALLFVNGYPLLGAIAALAALAVAVYVVADTYAVTNGAPFVAMESDRITALLALAELKPGERLADLGSGDGRIVIAAAKAGAFAEGWEVNPYLWLLSAWKIRRAGLADRARVHLGSYWPASFANADVVTLFLITAHMPRMQAKLQHELHPGSRVVSFVFSFPDWAHEKMSDNTFFYRKS